MILVGRFWGGGGDRKKVNAQVGLENDDYSGRPLSKYKKHESENNPSTQQMEATDQRSPTQFASLFKIKPIFVLDN